MNDCLNLAGIQVTPSTLTRIITGGLASAARAALRMHQNHIERKNEQHSLAYQDQYSRQTKEQK